MASLNKVIIIGRLGKDPIINTLQGGGKLVNFTVATSESWKDKAGQRQERTEWHNVAVLSPALADFAERYLQKGNQVYIEGKLQTREWTDKSGNKRYTTEINVGQYSGTLLLLESKQTAAPAEPEPAATTDAYAGNLEDDIPF